MERFDDSVNALSSVVDQIGAERSSLLRLPLAVFALERLLAHVRPSVDSKCPSDGKGLWTAREVARIRLYRKIISTTGEVRERDVTNFLVCDAACAAEASLPRKNVARRARTGMVCDPCASAVPPSKKGGRDT